MFKKKYIFSNTVQRETVILAIIKTVIGIAFLGILIYYANKYTHLPVEVFELRGQEDKDFIQRHWKDQNSVARFLMWGHDRRLLMLTVPYIDCVAMTGVILLLGALKRISGLLQLWIIISIIFCMIDMMILVPATTYADDKVLLLFSYIHSYMQKIYGFWICKTLLLEIAAEEDDNDNETESSSRSASPKKY